MVKVNLIKDQTVPTIKTAKLNTLEAIVFNLVLIATLVAPFILGLWTMYLINTTNFRSIIGF